MEGIVAVSLANEIDPILDSWRKGEVDLVSNSPTVRRRKPGNLMALTQVTLWGTDKTFADRYTRRF